MLGAIVGDVLGSVHEFKPIKTKDFDLLSLNCKLLIENENLCFLVGNYCDINSWYIYFLSDWGCHVLVDHKN